MNSATRNNCKLNLISLVLDELLHSIDLEQKPVPIDVAKVPSLEPAFRVESGRVRLVVPNISCKRRTIKYDGRNLSKKWR